MVRLKVWILNSVSKFSLSFQFQYGAIEGTEWLPRRDWQQISIPVWCDWRSEKRGTDIKILEFQFQYGAIEGLVHIFRSMSSAISIPVWCDWRIKLRNITIWRTYFNSSMVRLKEWRSSLFRRATRTISIPVWCDWRSIQLSVTVLLNWFQFQYGAIEGYIQSSSPRGCNTFQFQYGAIEGELVWRVPREEACISIPVWCDWRTVSMQYVGFRLYHFNSSMVRLKARCSRYRVTPSLISIPVWCDWRN